MNPMHVPGGLDAISFSGHKLPGGVSTPGVLIVKKRLLKLHIAPTNPGGGTVFFVTSHDHRYLSQREELRFALGCWKRRCQCCVPDCASAVQSPSQEALTITDVVICRANRANDTCNFIF